MINVIIVEDNIDDANALKNCINQYGEEYHKHFIINHYNDGNVFLNNYTGTDILFLDIMLPGVDGMTIAEKIREKDDNVIIVFVTNMLQMAIKGYSVRAFDFVIKPIFFKMLSKSFEFDKYVFDTEQKNIVRKPFVTFANKEFRINFRTVEFSGNYFIVYIIIPILILLLNNLFAAMNTKLSGEIMTYAFNILLILLPLLASNSMIATLYSKEGRAGYIKKTKPINPLGALVAKLLFNLVFSVISIIVSVAIFASFTKIGIAESIFLALAILLIQYGHIFYSATLDIMNPQNEQYATIGDEISNPNENKSTLVAFIMSFAIAFVSYVFLNESYSSSGSFLFGSVKIFILSLFIFGSFLLMFLLKIKAYYYER